MAGYALLQLWNVLRILFKVVTTVIYCRQYVFDLHASVWLMFILH